MVPADGVKQQPLIGLRYFAVEGVAVTEGHICVRQLKFAARLLARHAENDALFRLDHENYGVRCFRHAIAEKVKRLGFEPDADFCSASVKRFAGAHINRDAGPLLRIDVKFQFGEGLGRRLRVDPFFGAIPLILVPVAFLDAQRAQNIGFFIADVLGPQRLRHVHGQQA